MTDQEDDALEIFERTAVWLFQETRKLRKMPAGAARDSIAREIMTRSESLKKELERWMED